MLRFTPVCGLRWLQIKKLIYFFSSIFRQGSQIVIFVDIPLNSFFRTREIVVLKFLFLNFQKIFLQNFRPYISWRAWYSWRTIENFYLLLWYTYPLFEFFYIFGELWSSIVLSLWCSYSRIFVVYIYDTNWHVIFSVQNKFDKCFREIFIKKKRNLFNFWFSFFLMKSGTVLVLGGLILVSVDPVS